MFEAHDEFIEQLLRGLDSLFRSIKVVVVASTCMPIAMCE